MIEGLMMGLTDLVEVKKPKVVAIIPARGGSKRLERKNIYPVWGKPMLYWAIKAAKESEHITDVWVTTEDEEIKRIALESGASVHTRDPELSQDHVYKMEAIRSAASFIERKHFKPEIIVSLQANSPEITGVILDNAIESFVINDRNELISVDDELMMNAAFRIMKNWYIYQRDLSTKTGAFICDVHDVHTIEDVKFIEKRCKR
jgi:CMP-N-acetylneuraminic acid synthetase